MKRSFVIPYLIVYILIISDYTIAQVSTQETLWSMVQDCNNAISEGEGEIIDDFSNGYVKVSGSFPTCGCSCTSEAGAYKANDGTFTFIVQENWDCTWTRKVRSNREITNILPPSFGIEEFMSDKNTKIAISHFYLEFEIPRNGTDTRVNLKLIPFGILKKGNPLVYAYSEEEIDVEIQALDYIQQIAQLVSTETTLNQVLAGKYSLISKEDSLLLINQEIPFEQITSRLVELKQVYDLYMMTEYTSLKLGWDREKKQFFIKEKYGTPAPVTFLEFLRISEFWGPIC